MEKQKRWQFYLIIAVMLLTLYNILPTLFYYSKPLNSPIDEPRARQVAVQMVDRVNQLENDAVEWVYSFAHLLKLSPQSVQLKQDDPGLIEVVFSTPQEAETFKRYLPQAGVLIPFIPSQLELFPAENLEGSNRVLVARQIYVHLNPTEVDQLFHYTPKYESTGVLAPAYKNLVYDRATQIAIGFGGPSKIALQLAAIADNPTDSQFDEFVLSIAKEVVDVPNTLGKNSPIVKRFFASFTQIDRPNPEQLITAFLTRAETLKNSLANKKDTSQKELQALREKGELQKPDQERQIQEWNAQRQTLEEAIAVIQKNQSVFKEGKKPLTKETLRAALQAEKSNLEQQKLNLNGHNPYVQSLVINWGDGNIQVQLYPDVIALRNSPGATEAAAYGKEKLNQYLIQEISRASQFADETITPADGVYAVQIDQLPNTQSVLTMNLGEIAQRETDQIAKQLRTVWQPATPDLSSENYPVLTHSQYLALTPESQRLGLVVYAPAAEDKTPYTGFRTGSIYVIARNLNTLLQKYQQASSSPEAQEVISTINQLNALLQQKGFIGYPGNTYGVDPAFRQDYIFEKDSFYNLLLKATREDLSVKGDKENATLDFSDVEQRILTENRIEDRMQEDLLKWKEEYSAAQVDTRTGMRYLIPAPTQNPYWENFKISAAKYFRGDDRKILKWGLDLSGGKTVRIGLRDHNNRPVTNPDDLRQAVNELYTRLNNMGVSERTIHIENNNIIVDFPGSQNLSAAELIKASAMYFHIVNEKFGNSNPNLKKTVNDFLQSVWNEAVVTNRKDIESINTIAWQHLGGDSEGSGTLRPISEAARELYDNGLRLANPKDSTAGHSFNDTLSKVAMLRGEDYSQWEGQAHPLLIVFYNYALEGSSLTNIQVGYDPSQGNLLTFSVKSSYEGGQGGNPRDDFYAWTSQFAEDKIAGTPKEAYSRGHGWRMAVILNDRVISAPTLRAALRDGATITGRFSQREVNQLAADLKAGSLSFTPQILSEENVSPELGKEERMQGILASLVALALVVIAMVAYYRFAGLVASCAVLFNILIMWGVLQNLGAALTLPGIAGIVLTIGMAVDANVLVFERIREEFAISGRIASAIQAGYRKAFSAIVDSNITTIIAALILIQFDSGPIKGFAVTLIIGILSSMFTALFMTRYFFAGWVQDPEHKTLTMSQFIGKTHFNFLSKAKPVIIASLLIMAFGTFMFIEQRKTMLGMDFTGGYSLNVEVAENPNIKSYRLAAMNALMSHGATSNDIQIRELSRPNHLRIQLGTSIEEKGHPFYQMPETLSEGHFTADYQRNPRIVWIVNALKESGLQIPPSELQNLDWTVISGQLSDTMRNNALIALTIALMSILIYITFRFEFKYALAAVIALIHDVIITVGILAIFHALGFAVQIDLQVIGAIMTIIGYSLNDTIIVFDRIREDLHILRKMSYPDIINHALNVTLSRTLMTSGTTLLVLITLVLLGGQSIFAFSLVMTIGVLVGTASSLFIATPALLYLHNREERQQKLART